MDRKEKVDLLAINGRIYTVDSAFSKVEALSVRDGRIIATGSTEDMLQRFSAKDTLDLMGHPVYPGFIDAHCHFVGFARNLQFADLSGARSFDEVIQRLQNFRLLERGSWLAGRGWDQNLWQDRKFPDREMLDKAFPGIPVILIRVDGHAVLASEEALRRAGIGPGHPFLPAEVRTEKGRLTGILCERAADYIREEVPSPGPDEMAGLIHLAKEECFSFGLTALSDAGLQKQQVLLLDSLQKAGLMPLRVHVMLELTRENLDYFLPKGPYMTERLRVSAVKVYSDGSLGSRSAFLKKPYTDDPHTRGIPVITYDSLKSICELAKKHGFQVCTHAIGDSANSMVLNTYSKVLRGKNDLRWRIEHAQVIDPSDRHLFGEYDIIPSVQAKHATSDMYWAEERLGPERMKGAYAYHSLMLQNGWIPNGTDFPIEKISPVLTFYAAVVRKDIKGYPPEGFFPQEALSREEALRSITIWAARACFWEKELGSLEQGKRADFVVLDKDILSNEIEDILNTKVILTYIDGLQVYKR